MQKTCKNRPRPGARRRRRRSGRGLEGRAHQAACRIPIEGLRYKYTRALFLKSINWVPPPPQDFSDDLKKGPRGTPKDVKKTLKNPRALRDAQRVKTRGPNPNPTAQAQSKRCLPLSTKTQNIIEFVLILTSILGDFFEYFPQKWLKGSRATPKSAYKTPTWTPRVPKWSPRVPK